MNRKSMMILFTMLITVFIALAIKELITPQQLSVDAIREQIKTSYNGELLSLVEKPNQYIASFKKGQMIFEVTVDDEHGQFSNLTLVQKLSEPPTNDALDETVAEPNNDDAIEPTKEAPNEQQTETPKKPTAKPAAPDKHPVTVITEQQAIKIALQEVSGELDSIEFHQTTDGGLYEIEVEQEDDEVLVLVHAITGEILSIKYED